MVSSIEAYLKGTARWYLEMGLPSQGNSTKAVRTASSASSRTMK